MGRFATAAAALVLLCACHTGTGGSPPFNPFNPTPSISQTITSGITANAGLSQAVVGPDNRVWFTEFSGNNLAAVTTTGAVTEYAMGANSQPNAIVVGPDGNIWTGGFGGKLFSVTTSGVTTAYSIAGAHIGGMVVGPDANIWFTDYGNKRVGYITTSGIVTSYAAPAGSIPSQIAKGVDGNLWVTDSSGAILQVTTAGAFTRYRLGLGAGASPQAIISAPDGNLYFTEPFFSASERDKIGRITTSGIITELGSIAPNSYPNQLAIGKNGNLYFTEYNTGNLGELTIPGLKISETPLALTQGGGIVNGVDNNLWVGGRETIWKIAY